MPEPLPPARHETRDINFTPMLIAAVLMAAAVVFTASIAYLIFPHSTLNRSYVGPVPDFAKPRLEPAPRADLHAFFEQKMKTLNSVGWVDRKAGIVHIPIDQAMRELARRGIPDWPGSAPPSGPQPSAQR